MASYTRKCARTNIAILFVMTTVGGCQCLGENCDKHPWCHHAAPAVPATVDVGGLIKQPGALLLPPEGLTLQQAILRAGGVVVDPKTAYLIQLRRGTGAVAANFYYSAEYVLNGLAGEIALQPHDLIQVIPVGDSPLNTYTQYISKDKGGRYSVLGEVPSPGGRTIVQPLQFNELMGPKVNVANLTMVLTRVSPQGRGIDQFILSPTDFGNARRPEIGIYFVADGDTFEFLPLNLVPVVATGVMRTAAARIPASAQAKKCAPLAQFNGPIAGTTRQLCQTTQSLVRPFIPTAPTPVVVQVP